MDSIGMEHKLHLKKLLLARQKLTPLSAAEQSMASSVRREDSATAAREEIPDIDTAFSQARFRFMLYSRNFSYFSNDTGMLPLVFSMLCLWRSTLVLR